MSRLVHREAGPTDGPAALLVHGFPESSYMWRHALDALGEAGFRAVAPDLAGFGDSPPDRPGTWEHHVELLEAFRVDQGLNDVLLVVHDWGGLIGLRWACENPDAIRALVISDSSFFADGEWHGMGETLRTEGQGEETVKMFTPELLRQTLQSLSTGIDDAAAAECAKCLDGDDRRAALLELYRSGDFDKLEPYEGRLAALDVPTLIVWGGTDPFSAVANAHRFQKEIPGSDLMILEEAGHFVWDDEPARTSDALTRFAQALPG